MIPYITVQTKFTKGTPPLKKSFSSDTLAVPHTESPFCSLSQQRSLLQKIDCNTYSFQPFSLTCKFNENTLSAHKLSSKFLCKIIYIHLYKRDIQRFATAVRVTHKVAPLYKYRAFNQGGNREESVEPEQHFSHIAALTADSRMSH
jgi:hypothetical protein